VKPYKQDPEITAMNDLMMAYQRNEIKNFEQILKQNQQKIMEVYIALCILLSLCCPLLCL